MKYNKEECCCISITNWDKYQSRSDKAMPWCKLWGDLFFEHWMQSLHPKSRYALHCLMDFARRERNSMVLFYMTFNRQYALRMRSKDIKNLVYYLKGVGFLSDGSQTKVGLDKIREDKIREDKRREDCATLVGQKDKNNGHINMLPTDKLSMLYEKQTGKKL